MRGGAEIFQGTGKIRAALPRARSGRGKLVSAPLWQGGGTAGVQKALTQMPFERPPALGSVVRSAKLRKTAIAGSHRAPDGRRRSATCRNCRDCRVSPPSATRHLLALPVTSRATIARLTPSPCRIVKQVVFQRPAPFVSEEGQRSTKRSIRITANQDTRPGQESAARPRDRTTASASFRGGRIRRLPRRKVGGWNTKAIGRGAGSRVRRVDPTARRPVPGKRALV
jgi:hypothetical protein